MMKYRKVTAIVRCEVLEKVEDALRSAGIAGISVSFVKGYGDYANFFRNPPLTKHARIEVFTGDTEVDVIVDTIMGNAHSGLSGDGIVAVLPVEHLYRIRDGKQVET